MSKACIEGQTNFTKEIKTSVFFLPHCKISHFLRVTCLRYKYSTVMVLLEASKETQWSAMWLFCLCQLASQYFTFKKYPASSGPLFCLLEWRTALFSVIRYSETWVSSVHSYLS